jgi:hypothetical protein
MEDAIRMDRAKFCVNCEYAWDLAEGPMDCPKCCSQAWVWLAKWVLPIDTDDAMRIE